jgi:hypothetical protein
MRGIEGYPEYVREEGYRGYPEYVREEGHRGYPEYVREEGYRGVLGDIVVNGRYLPRQEISPPCFLKGPKGSSTASTSKT